MTWTRSHGTLGHMVTGSMLLGFIIGGIALYGVGKATAIRGRAQKDRKTLLAGMDKVAAAARDAARVEIKHIVVAALIAAVLIASISHKRDAASGPTPEPSPGTGAAKVAEIPRR